MSNLYKLFKSFTITALVSLLLASVFPEYFWPVFGLTTLVQIILSAIITQIYSNRVIREFEDVRTSQIKEANRNVITVPCPCDERAEITIDYRFDEENIAVCSKCEKNIRCTAGIGTAVTTDPIYFER
tara:strand:- start:1285 stop:1668 length:384 start_codon:yes stop_codon:yes gene_type:complete